MLEFFPRPRFFVDEVRDAADVEALVDIHSAGFQRGWSLDEFEQLLVDPTVFCLLLRRESMLGVRRVLGFVLVRQVAGEAEILSIAVAPARRGRGYGRMLMEDALRRLYRELATALFLEVAEQNAPAVGLYRSLGFAEVGRRRGYYRDSEGRPDTALVMRLQVR